ncbi:MAG TPA: type VI secretion system contractile sheath small subunit [Pyrinomonadaceae bacterium]|jgi:type VI secretion system protein ImpB|nr:type VI secretion system contractile sheath small subunit [Pyrinomonadaceae bacterium]
MAESIQHKLDRVRPPRVQITYDVEIGDAIVMKELPFVVGILADLSGMPDKELPVRYDLSSHNGDMLPIADKKDATPLKERKYVNIDRDNFNDVMKSIAPRLVFADIRSRKLTGKKVELDKVTGKPVKVVEADTPAVDEKGAERKMKWETADDAVLKDVGMEFTNIEHFDPFNIIRQVKPLRELYEARSRLSDLLVKLEGNEALSAQLRDEIFKKSVATAKDELEAILRATGVAPTAAAGDDKAEDKTDGNGGKK